MKAGEGNPYSKADRAVHSALSRAIRKGVGCLILVTALAVSRGAQAQGTIHFSFDTNHLVWTNVIQNPGGFVFGSSNLYPIGGPGDLTNLLGSGLFSNLNLIVVGWDSPGGRLGSVSNLFAGYATSPFSGVVSNATLLKQWVAPPFTSFPLFPPASPIPLTNPPNPFPPIEFYIGEVNPTPNDHFAGGTVIPPDTVNANFPLAGCSASSESGEPPQAGRPALASLWWKWTPSYVGKVRLMASTPGSCWKLDVFTGPDLLNLELIKSDRSRLSVPGKASVVRLLVSQGQTYYIRLSLPVDRSSPATQAWSVLLSGGALTLSGVNDPLPGEVNFSLFYSVMFWNRCIIIPSGRVYQPDGRTPLTGSHYLAQLYGGPTAADLLPAGTAQPFFESTDSPGKGLWNLNGLFCPTPVLVPNTVAGRRLFAQVRVWDSTFGATYEEALANGGPVGESRIVSAVAGSELTGPSKLRGIGSFSLHPGSVPTP